MESKSPVNVQQRMPRPLRKLGLQLPHFAAISFIISLLLTAVHRVPLGHDESVYALRARDLSSGYAYLSGKYWGDFRAPGLSFIDHWLFSMFGENDFVARLPVMFFGLLLFISTYLLAKELFGRRIADIAAVLFVATPPLVLNSSLLLADIPGSSISISCVLLVFYLQRIGAKHTVVLTCIFVLGSIATLLRFGSFITYGSGIFAASLYLVLANRHKPKLAKCYFNQLTLQLVSLFSFGWIYFTDVTSVNGTTPYEANSQLAAGAGVTPLNGMFDLIALTNPFSTQSVWLNPIFGILTLFSLPFALTNLKAGSKVRLQTLSVFVAGLLSLSFLVVGVRYVQDNYLALTAPFWIILSAAGFDFFYRSRLKGHRGNTYQILNIKVIPTAIGLLLIFLPVYYFVSAYMKTDAPRFGIRAAGEAIHIQANDEKCLVLSSYPESAWYSKCLLGGWIGKSEHAPELGATSDEFNQITVETIKAFKESNWKAMRNNEQLEDYRKFVVMVVDGKRQPSEKSIRDDKTTLLERRFTTERVFFAEINSDSLSVP